MGARACVRSLRCMSLHSLPVLTQESCVQLMQIVPVKKKKKTFSQKPLGVQLPHHVILLNLQVVKCIVVVLGMCL